MKGDEVDPNREPMAEIVVPSVGADSVTRLDMKADWNVRAAQNARQFIASHEDDDESSFVRSGARDTGLFFGDLEHLLGPTRVVLDIGCGIGRMDAFVAPHVGHLHGVDVSGEMVRQAKERLAHLGNVTFHEGDGWSLDGFRDASIDVVFSHIVMQHAPREVFVAYLPEVWRVLVPGGSFVFQMPEAVPGAPADPPYHDSLEMRFWTEPDIRSRIEAAGFEWQECRRFPVDTPNLVFDQLRIRVTKPVHARPK